LSVDLNTWLGLEVAFIMAKMVLASNRRCCALLFALLRSWKCTKGFVCFGKDAASRRSHGRTVYLALGPFSSLAMMADLKVASDIGSGTASVSVYKVE